MKWIVSAMVALSILQLAWITLGFIKKFEVINGYCISGLECNHVDVLNVTAIISVVLFIIAFLKEYRDC